MKIHLVRHGRMAGDPHQYFEAPVSGCLSPEGVAQAEAMGKAMAHIAFDRVFASPLGRAIQTAQALTRKPGVGIEIREWLIEWRPAHILQGSNPANYEQLCKDSALLRPEKTWKTEAGEGALEMAARLVPGWIALMESLGVHAGHGGYLLDNPEDDRNVALVAHGGSLGHLLSFILGVPIRPNPPISFALTGVATINFVQMADVWYPALEIPAPKA